MNTKRIFFERIRTIHLPVVLYHLWRGHKVNAFDFTHDMKRRRWLRLLINSGRVGRIYVDTLSPLHGTAIDLTEKLSDKLGGNTIRRAVAKLYRSDEAGLIFKKSLLPEIFKCLYISAHLRDVNALCPSDTLVFFPDRHDVYKKLIAASGEKSADIPPRIRAGKWYKPIAATLRINDGIGYYLPRWNWLVSKIAMLVLAKLLPKAKSERKKFTYALAVEQKFQVRQPGKRYFDFLLDGESITPKNTVFLFRIPLDVSLRKYCTDNGYSFVEMKRLTSAKSLLNSNCPWLMIRNCLAAMVKMPLLAYHPLPLVTGAIISLRAYIEHNLLGGTISFDHYIYTNQEHPGQIAANTLVRRCSRKTWNYSLAIGGGFIHATDKDFSSKRNIIWAYLNSDRYVVACPDAVKYNKIHLQHVGQYHDVGCVFSQMVREYQDHPGKEKLAQKFFDEKISERKKVVSFFDTTFIYAESAPTTLNDAAGFYRDILHLLEQFEDILVIIKPAKDRIFFTCPNFQWSIPSQGAEIIELWDSLQRHQRVCWAGIAGDTSAIIAASDLVVTHCMSSPTFESLGARKRAIWYESGQKHRGVLYDTIPSLIAHGYQELEQSLRKLLWQTSDDEYNDYLDRKIKGTIESYMDSQALTRFRKLLTERKTNE